MSREITIYGLSLSITAPYGEGHVLNAAEANVLNQTRAENIGNNVRAKIKELQAEDKTFSDEAKQKAQKLISEVDADYTFSMPGSGGGRRVADPVEREAISIARDLIGRKLKEQGKTLKGVMESNKDALEAKIAEVAASDAVMAEARKRINARAKLSVEDLAF